MEKRTVFFTMVMHPATGWTRVGNAYPSRKAAAEWLPFVRGAWRGLRAKVSQCTVRLDGGKVCEQSRRLLDEKYNLDAERVGDRRCAALSRSVQRAKRTGSTVGLCLTGE